MVLLTEAHGWILSALLSTLGVLAWLLGDASTARYGSGLCLLAAALLIASASQRAPEVSGTALIFVLIAAIMLTTRSFPHAPPGVASDRSVTSGSPHEFLARPEQELPFEGLGTGSVLVEFQVVSTVREAGLGTDREPTP